jgi:hypothetical protein
MPVGGGLFQIDMTGMGPDWSYYTTRATIAAYRIKPVRLGDAQLRQYCFYASFETRNQIRTPQTELNGVVLCPKLSSLVLG